MKRVAIVGCGQLARMLALAGRAMGIRFAFVACDGESVECVEGLGTVVHWREADLDAAALFAQLGGPDVVTVERENVSVALLRELQAHCPVYPDPQSVAHCQNRLGERTLLRSLAICTAPFIAAPDSHAVAEAVERLGMPVLVKHASAGYDGKHQWRIRTAQDLLDFANSQTGGEWLVEKWVPFDYEVSLIAARSVSGEVAIYPATRNRHENGVLLRSVAPARPLPVAQEATAVEYLSMLLDAMNYVGVLTVECFVVGARILVNELAPRVHNSGHWTLHADVTSQFENHLRAILDLPLGNTRLRGFAGMINLLGVEPGPECYAALGGSASLHWYDKQVRSGRKLGHVAVSAVDRAGVEDHLDRLESALYGDTVGDSPAAAGSGASEPGPFTARPSISAAAR